MSKVTVAILGSFLLPKNAQTENNRRCFVGFEVEQTRSSLHFCRRNTAWNQFLPSKVVAGSIYQCLFVCHQMFREIVLGGTILLFITRATFNIYYNKFTGSRLSISLSVNQFLAIPCLLGWAGCRQSIALIFFYAC